MRKIYVSTMALFAFVQAQAQTTDTLSRKQELDEVTVSGLKATDKNPVTFTNVSKKEITKQNFGQDIPFLLNLTPSSVASSDAGTGIGYTGIRIRGTDNTRTNVTVNGVPINDAESHGMFWVNMPDLASSAQNIQVQRGVGTSSNGAAAFGASINVETDALNADAYGEVSNSFGSFNTWKSTVKAGTGLLDNQWVFDARLSRVSSDGYIDRASSNLKSFFLSGARYGEKSMLKVNVFSGVEKTYQAWNGIEESILKAGNRTHNDYTYANQTDNYQQDHYQAFYTYLFNKQWKTHIGLHYTYGRGYYEEFREDEAFGTYKLPDTLIVVNGSNLDTLTSGNFIRRRWLDNDFYGTVYSLNYTNDKWNIILGGAANRYDGRHRGELIWAQYAQGSNINDTFYMGTSVKSELSVYLKTTYAISNKFSGFVDLQTRMVDYTGSGEDLNSGVYVPYSFHLQYNFFNPKAGLTYDINEGGNVYGYVGVANREPVRNDIIQASASSIPKPERLLNYELGYRRTWKKSAIAINGFLMDYKDQLVLTGQMNDVGAYNRVNVPKSYRAGIELSGGVQLTEALRWQATLTYSQNKIQSYDEYLDDTDNGGQVKNTYKNTSIAYSPDWVGSSLISYTLLKGLNMALISKWVGKQYLDNTQSDDRKLDAFFVNDLRFSYDFSVAKVLKGVRAGLLVNNIFNVEYESNGATYPGGISGGVRNDYNYYFPQAGTNIMGSLVLIF